MYLSIDVNNNIPMYLQIVTQIKEQVRKEILKPGDELPSVRELARVLGVNMHTIRNAYLKLREQGLINMRLGRRATVTRVPRLADKHEAAANLQSRMKELVTDGLLAGLTPEDVCKVIETEVRQMNDAVMKKGD